MVALHYDRHPGGQLCLPLPAPVARALGAERGDIVRLEALGDGSWRLVPSGRAPRRAAWAASAAGHFRAALAWLGGGR